MFAVQMMDKKTIRKSSQYIDSLVEQLLEMRGYSKNDEPQHKKIKRELQEVFSLLEIELILCGNCDEDDLLIPTHNCRINAVELKTEAIK
jgi:hypothetical protein